jgi:hypothetical protein
LTVAAVPQSDRQHGAMTPVRAERPDPAIDAEGLRMRVARRHRAGELAARLEQIDPARREPGPDRLQAPRHRSEADGHAGGAGLDEPRERIEVCRLQAGARRLRAAVVQHRIERRVTEVDREQRRGHVRDGPATSRSGAVGRVVGALEPLSSRDDVHDELARAALV